MPISWKSDWLIKNLKIFQKKCQSMLLVYSVYIKTPKLVFNLLLFQLNTVKHFSLSRTYDLDQNNNKNFAESRSFIKGTVKSLNSISGFSHNAEVFWPDYLWYNLSKYIHLTNFTFVTKFFNQYEVDFTITVLEYFRDIELDIDGIFGTFLFQRKIKF